MTTIRVEHADGTTTNLEHSSDSVERELTKMTIGTARTPRTEADGVSFSEGDDEVYIDDGTTTVFGGRLKTVNRKPPEVELVINSFEMDAKQSEPTAPDNRYISANDDTVVTDAVSSVSSLSAGTVNNVESGLSFVFPHTSQAKKIRTVESATDGEVKYNHDKTVDYVDRLGSDISASVVVKPGNQNVVDSVKVTREGSSKQKVTHLRMLGAGEGAHQQRANIVPSADGSSYHNKTTYSSSWSSGDREKWDVYTNKDLTSVDAIKSAGKTLIAELDSSHLEVETTIKDEDISLGDTVHVKKPSEDVDSDLRVVRLVRVNDKKGLRYKVALSSRVKTRGSSDSKTRQDVSRFNSGFEGTPVTFNVAGGRQPLDGTHDYEFDFYYPAEVEHEHRVKLFVKGLAYRAYSSGAASGGDHTHSVDVDHPSHDHDVSVTHPNHTHDVTHPNHTHDVTHPSHDHDVSISDTSTENTPHGDVASAGSDLGALSDSGGNWDDMTTISPNTNYEVALVWVACSKADSSVEVRLQDANTVEYPASSGVPISGSGLEESGSVCLAIPDDVDQFDVQYKTDAAPNANFFVRWHVWGRHTHDVSDTDTSTAALGTTETSTSALGTNETSTSALGTTETATSSTELGTTQTETSGASGPHTHEPDPGVIESFGGTRHYPKNCDVVVNGTTIDTNLGDGTGPFEQEVDLAGNLNPGQVNTVRVTSQSLGHVQAHLDIDVYRQVLGNG